MELAMDDRKNGRMGMNGARIGTILLVLFVCLALILLWVTIWDTNRFVVKKYSFQSDKLKKDCRIVFLSDLHNREYGVGNERLLRAIGKLAPDLILAGGDMLTAKPGASFESAVNFITKCGEKYPVCHAFGNHEFRARLYPKVYGTMYRDYRESFRDSNIRFLDNESFVLPEFGIRLTGLTIDREYYKRFGKRKMREGYLEETVGKADPSSYQILLAHNPEYFPDYRTWKPDLVLSGHIHGGVVRIPGWKGILSPSLMPFPRYDGGLFEEQGRRMIISRGLGMHTIPVRLFNPGELVVVELKADGEKNRAKRCDQPETERRRKG